MAQHRRTAQSTVVYDKAERTFVRVKGDGDFEVIAKKAS